MSFRGPKALLCAFLSVTASASAQNAIRIDPANGSDSRLGRLVTPYRARSIPPVNLHNSARLDSLLRSGNLYLSAQDVVALAIENNIDIEVQRYGPLLQQEVLRRARAGGALRSVGVGVAAGPQSVSLTGVNVGSGGISASAAGNGVSSGGGIVTQLGPSIPSLDPTLLFVGNFQHQTTPLSNTILTGTTALITSVRTYEAQYSQNWDFGLSAQWTYVSNHIALNSQQYNLNPYTMGDLDLQVTQNLLQGFGSAVNARNIRVQKNNMKVTDLQFQQQVIATVSAALNLYWDLVSFVEDVQSREQAVKTAQQLYDDNKQQVQFGSLAEIEVTRAESQLYAARQDLVISQTNLLQQETILKNYLTRSGVAGSGLTDVHVIPLDKLQVPDKDEMKPLEQLMDDALKNRVEIAQGRINVESDKMNLVGIKNSLKPSLQAFAELTNNGLTGDVSPVGAATPGVGYLGGGYGNLLAQIARRNFPNYSAGFSLSFPLRNRAAQSDYATSSIELRQNELSLQKNMNQVEVDVRNAVIGLQQARARFDAAVKARVLQVETLKADQQKLALGASTPYQVVQDQRDLASAQSSEVQSMANYSHARIAFDQAVGRTLDVNHVSVEDARAGIGRTK